MSNAPALLSGDDAVALAMRHAAVRLGTGYPGTPSTEILQEFARLGGTAQWAPNEKVALEVAVGAAFGRARAVCTMKHVGVNVAADPLFTAAYTGVDGALVIIVCDDPGLASSQNEQDSRNYAAAAGVPMVEPGDSQQAYSFFFAAVRLSECYRTPVLFRMTTRVCHSRTAVVADPGACPPPPAEPGFVREPARRVMIPAYARAAHRRLRKTLDDIAHDDAFARELQLLWKPGADAAEPLAASADWKGTLGIVANGVAAMHAREAAPEAYVFQTGLVYPWPVGAGAAFAAKVERCVVVEEGDPVLFTAFRAADVRTAAGGKVEGRARDGREDIWRFGELNVERIRALLAGSETDVPPAKPGRPPQLCPGCPHRTAFEAIKSLDCIVSGDIGCYTLGVLPPFQAMDACVCMGASIGVGLGLRHVLPETEARRVVSVIGDSTFVHSGLTGLAEMAYNPPTTGHVVVLLDNGTTAMTGLQEHPGTGHTLKREPTGRIDYVAAAKALGIEDVTIHPLTSDAGKFAAVLKEKLDSGKLCLLIARRPCVLAARHLAGRKD